MNPLENQLTISVSVNEEGYATHEKGKNSIDKKIKKIEQLRKQLVKLKKTIEDAKKKYLEHCKGAEEQLFKLKEELIIKLYQRYQQKGFTLWQKELMEERIINEIEFLISVGFSSDIIDTIHDEITKLSAEKMDESEKEVMNEMAKEMFRDMGMEFDEDTFNFEDFINPEFRERFANQQAEQQKEKYYNFFEPDKEEEYTSKKEKVKTTDKDFQKLYKSLVKKAHPDLVTDPKEKEQREALMKKISQAWEHRNYYELLLLQKEIDVDSEDIHIKTSQIKPLIKELNKLINDLESEKYQIKNFDQNTAFYYQNFNARSSKGILKKVLEHQLRIMGQIDDTQEEISYLKTQKSTKELLTEVREANDFLDDPFGFFDDFENRHF